MSQRKMAKLLHTNGTLNIKPKGISVFNQKDFHNSMITMNWLSFFVVIISLFVLINVVFTAIYLLLGPEELNGVLKKDKWGYFFELFFFSTQTITTVGYGRISPVGIGAGFISAIEAMLGVILFAFATGLSYARFARPRPRILYSKNMLIAPFQDGKALMVRIVNYKINQLVDLTAEFVLTVHINVEGKPTRFFYTLPLEQEKIGMMMMSWVIVHKINDDSPLNGLLMDDLERSDAEILVMIKGADDVLSQNVFSRTSYKPSTIIWDAEFVSINEFDEAGNLQIDVSRMHDYKPAPVVEIL